MFSEILKIKPQMDSSDLRRMENTLNSRFKRIAKRFGKGITAVFKAGGAATIVLSLINKFLNPLKEVQASIERMLTSSDDIVTNAQQFGTTAGKLEKLIGIAQGSGLDQDSLFQMLSKFQTGVGRVKNNEKDMLAPTLGAYVKDEDLADSFFAFLQDLRKMDVKDQAVAKSAVFGERQSLKVNDLMQQDFAKRFKEVGYDKVSSESLTKAHMKLGGYSDLSDALSVQRRTEDLLNKSASINQKMIYQRHEAERLELKKENQRIQAYESLQAVQNTVDRMGILLEQGFQKIGEFITMITPKINELVSYLQKMANSKLFKGIGSVKDWMGF